MSKTGNILIEILNERRAQDAKWGEQNHPDFDPRLLGRPGGASIERLAEEYEIPTPWRGRQNCEMAAKFGSLSWLHILVEEVSETLVTDEAGELRKELVQVACEV